MLIDGFESMHSILSTCFHIVVLPEKIISTLWVLLAKYVQTKVPRASAAAERFTGRFVLNHSRLVSACCFIVARGFLALEMAFVLYYVPLKLSGVFDSEFWWGKQDGK